MIASLLIANRGEIACRVIRTARRLGIRTVAVYSDADATALHVRQADAALHIGPSPVRESYLAGDRLIAAAQASGVEAIHPGYGFLSENADFAQAVIAAGLIWVGPHPSSIRAMGLKDAAKARMIAAGVPVTPGYLGQDQSPERLRAEADATGYPVLIKAVAGGGGKGMRRVDEAGAFADALAGCRREAAASFGDDRVLIETYVQSPRHIEVQVFGDASGNVVHLFERDCSLQRRHQKVIEEAPAPGMDDATRQAVCAAAVRAAKAVDYVGAGTVEFIADAVEGLRADRIWFMEMNTRLQVEHPVTEAITGQDLVEWQLRVASGERLPLLQNELHIDGWAMEARLYAETPASGFLPSTGRLEHFTLPRAVRVETGVAQGDEVTAFYDPMIAKLVVHAPDRPKAIARLAGACGDVEIAPVQTNAAFLVRCLDLPEFRRGDPSTGLIAANLARLTEPRFTEASLLAAITWRADEFTEAEFETSGPKPWLARLDGLFGFRLNAPPQPARIAMDVDGVSKAVTLRPAPSADRRWVVTIDGLELGDEPSSLPTTYGAGDCAPFEGPIRVFEGGACRTFQFGRARLKTGAGACDGSLVAPMPGRVIAVEVAAGERVAKGRRLVTLEAMKMEHPLLSPFDGVVAELDVGEGDQVHEGALLLRLTPDA